MSMLTSWPGNMKIRVSFSLLLKMGGGGQNEIVWIIGGQVHIRVESMWQTRGVQGHAPPENLDFGPFIRRNLVESGTVFTQCHSLPFIVSLKLYN